MVYFQGQIPRVVPISVSPLPIYMRQSPCKSSPNTHATQEGISSHLLNLLGFVAITSIVLALNLLHDPLHLFRLLLPLDAAHLELLLKHLVTWSSVTASQTVPEGSELAVVLH